MLRSEFAKNPDPSWCRGDEGGGWIRCWISGGTGSASQVKGKTGLRRRPEPALTSALVKWLEEEQVVGSKYL